MKSNLIILTLLFLFSISLSIKKDLYFVNIFDLHKFQSFIKIYGNNPEENP